MAFGSLFAALPGIGQAVGAASAIGSLFNQNRKMPGAPGYVGEAGKKVVGIGDDLTELGGQLYDLQGPLLNNIGPAFDKRRSLLQEINPYIRTQQQQLGAGMPYWNQADTMFAQDAVNAGSRGQILRQRGLAYDDAMTGLGARSQAENLQRKAAGLGAAGGAFSPAARYGHLAGAAANQAGERERQLGFQLRSQAAQMAPQRRGEILNLARMPAEVQNEIGSSYAQQAELYNQVIAPYLNTMGNAASVYSGAGGLGGVQGGLNQAAFAHNQQQQGQMFGQLGQLGFDLFKMGY